MTDEAPSDDYFSAAAEVVEAARKLDEAKAEYKKMHDATVAAHVSVSHAERVLHDALEKLKSASTGRKS